VALLLLSDDNILKRGRCPVMQCSYWIAEILSVILMSVFESCWTDLCISLRGFYWNLKTEGKIKFGTAYMQSERCHSICTLYLLCCSSELCAFCVGDIVRFCSMHVVDVAWSAVGLCLFVLFTGGNEHYFYFWFIFLLTHENKLLFLRHLVKCVLLLGVHNHM
jgi:hypothetical protein